MRLLIIHMAQLHTDILNILHHFLLRAHDRTPASKEKSCLATKIFEIAKVIEYITGLN